MKTKLSIRRYLGFSVPAIAVATGAVYFTLGAWPALLLMGALLGLSAWLFVRWIITPIAAVSEAAAAIARGEYDTRVELPKVRSEIHRMGVEINNMAEKIAFAERTKLDFVSTISHELRTPLTAIKGWGETLLHSDHPPNEDILRRGLGVIIDESMRLDKLVEELLDFSRIQAGRLVLQKEPVDILAELDEVVYFFCEQRAASDGIALQSSTPEIPAPSLGDPARIRQIFINLLDNAFKHTQQGGAIAVTAGFTPELPKDRPPASPPEFVHITISDSGCGVSEEDLPHLTEKFFKASTDTKGSGIGLAVVEELIKAHNGVLEFESAPGEGLSVHVTFPLKK